MGTQGPSDIGAGVGPLRGSDNSHCPFVEGDYNICPTVTSKELQITRRGKLQRIPGLKEKEQRRIIFVCFSVFWTCNNVISILCTLLHKRMNPIPVKRSIVGLFYEWIVGLFYEWVVNLSLSVFEWGLVSTDSNEVTWMYFTVIIHLLYYKWKNEWIRLNLFSKNVRTWHNCIDVWYLFKHV